MAQVSPDQQTRAPLPAPRLVAAHVAGRTWTVRYSRPGSGAGWGHALAALDCRSHGVTSSGPPTWWLDEDALRTLVGEVNRLGVRVETVDGSSLPTALVR